MVDHVSTKECDKQSVSYFGPKIWNFITQETKILTTLAAFKKQRLNIGNLLQDL